MFSHEIQERLEGENVSLDGFQELLVRLLNYGILSRNESLVEQQLYDRYLRVVNLVEDYFSLIGVKIHHDRRLEYIRLYPPGSRVPGMEEAEENAFGGSLRARLSQNEVALILVLRTQYDKALREGKIDEEGYVAESLESLIIALKNLLGRSLPDKATERRRLFQRIRQLRLIKYNQEDDLESGEAWLKIHPMIVSFVDDDVLRALESIDTSASANDEVLEGDEDVS